jgi:hypothetical protein
MVLDEDYISSGLDFYFKHLNRVRKLEKVPYK